MIRCWRFRLIPRRRQHLALNQILEGQRQLYNAALEERIDAYRKAGVTLTYYDQLKGLTEWRQSDEDAWGIPANLQRFTLHRLDRAFKGFFRRVGNGLRSGYPRFKGARRFKSFGFREFVGITLRNGRLHFKGMPGGLRLHLHREIPEGSDIRACVFKRGVKGWAVSLLIEVQGEPREILERVVGVDLGISVFAALSDGGFIPSLRAGRRAARKLRVAQRALARRNLKSSGWQRARKVVAQCHASAARQRTEYLHQASARLLRDYDVIVVERLNVKGLIKGALAKDVTDASWSKFLSMLRYKAEWAGARVIEVDPRDTSQICSGCSARVPKPLSERMHRCTCCALVLDRDQNAARNILHRAGVGPVACST